jgi:hypothetical protein
MCLVNNALVGKRTLMEPRIYWIVSKYVAGKFMFPDKKKYLQIVYTIWLRVQKEFRQPYPRPGKFKEHHFDKAPNF